MPWWCVRGARGRFGGVGARAGFCVFPVSPLFTRVSRAVCGGPSRPGVPYPRSLVRHSMRSVHSASLVQLPFWYSRVRALTLSRRPRAPPLWVGVARAPRAVPVLSAGRAVPRGPCPSACPASVPCALWLAWEGGGGPVPFPPCLAWSCVPPFGRALGACGRAVGAGGAVMWTRHQPHSARSCELALHAVEAARGRLGGAPLAWVWGVRGRALPHTRPPVLWGVRPGPTTHWLCLRGVRAWGRVIKPRAHSCELALRAVGAARGRPGGAPLACVSGVWGRALSHPRPPALWSVRPGPTTLWLWVRGVRVWGPLTNPTARALASWLCAPWGRHEGARGGRPLPGGVASGVGRSPTPDRPSFRACGRGPLPTGCGCGGCGRGDPSPTPQRALLRAGFARCGGGMRAAGGGAILPGCGASRVGRSPNSDCPSFGACGRGPLPTGCGCRRCERGGPSPTPQRALLRAGLARCGGSTRAPGGGASYLGVGRPVSGTLPAPTARPLRRAAGPHYPLALGAGGAGVGTRHQPHSARSCELALRAVGAAGGPPGGTPPAWVWGVRGRALSHPRLPVL